MWFTSTLAAASLLAGTALAVGPAPPQSWCTTRYGTRSMKSVPTQQRTYTRTYTPTVVVSAGRTVTLTPSPVGSTSVVTETDTVTSTIQSTDTSTSVVTESTTSFTTLPTQTVSQVDTTSSETTVTSTTTIGSTAGFTPVRSSLPGSSYNGAYGGPQSKRKRSLARSPFEEGFTELEERAGRSKPNCLGSRKYPQSVSCLKIVFEQARAVTYTRPVRSTTTVTAVASTSVTTSTALTTITTTSVSLVDTTVSSTTTVVEGSIISPVTTTTSTTTIVSTVQAPSATAYAQCISNNFANGLNGNTGIYLLAASNGADYGVQSIASITNALDCCNACAAASNCATSIYTESYGGCNLLTGCGLTFPTVQDSTYDWVVNNGCSQDVPN